MLQIALPRPTFSDALCGGLVLCLLLAAGAQAQQNTPTVNPPCELGPISYVFVDNRSIFDTQDIQSSRRFGWFFRAANALHVRTRRSVVARELLFGPGDCYDPVLVEESERVLRSNDFLAQVEIYGVPQPDGSYHVIVDTRDEWSTQGDLRVSWQGGLDFEGARLREANFLGRGTAVGAYYIDREVTRDYGISFFTPQLTGTRWDLQAELGRTRAGTVFSQALAYPFVGEVSRWSTREQYSREDRFFDYIVDDETQDRVDVLLPVRDKHFDLALVARLGQRGNLTLLGGGLTYQQLSYPGLPLIAVDGEDIEPTTPAESLLVVPALSKREQLSSIRFALFVGQRRVRWVKRRGLDSMRGQQDVRLGVEAGIALARSIPSLEDDNDLTTTATLYGAFERGALIVGGRGRFDARRDFAAPTTEPGWEDVYADAELLAYLRPPRASRHTFVMRAAGTGGWNIRTPFQLTLGGDRNLRGYPPDRLPGGRRAVFSAEHRLYWGWPRPGRLDIGHTAFVDWGHMWPGDAPYGRDSGWRATIGAGLRASFPAGSRTTYRIDVAWPVGVGANASDLRLMISVGELLGLSVPFRDVQLSRSRYEGIAGQLFRFRP
jgi:hypothetical protein